jgi:hypothetical protein
MDDIILNNDEDNAEGSVVGGEAGEESLEDADLSAAEAERVEDMDPETQLILKLDLEGKLKAGKKLSEEEMKLAEELMGDDILKYLDEHKKEESPAPKNPLPEEEEEEIEVAILRKVLGEEK